MLKPKGLHRGNLQVTSPDSRIMELKRLK